MKVRLDENLSYRVANALKAFLADRTGLSVDWVRDHHPPGTKDPSWIRQFADDGGHAIISGDYQILQHWPDLIAYIESGLVSFFPPPNFDKLRGFGQASLMIRWWPVMVEHAKSAPRGTCWRLPMHWTPEPAKLQPLRDPRVATAAQQVSVGIQPPGTVHQFRRG